MQGCEPQVDFKLHHVGVAVDSIDAAAARFARHFGYAQVSPVGFRTFILDVPANEAELKSMRRVFQRAEREVG